MKNVLYAPADMEMDLTSVNIIQEIKKSYQLDYTLFGVNKKEKDSLLFSYIWQSTIVNIHSGSAVSINLSLK